MEQPGRVQIFKPQPALQGIVQNYFFGSEASMYKCNPAIPEQCLVFFPYRKQTYTRDGIQFESFPRQMFVGPRTEPIFFRFNPDQLVIIVNLLPGVLHRLTKIPLNEIMDKLEDGINGFGNEIQNVNYRLGSASTAEMMMSIIDLFLLGKVPKAKDAFPIDEIFKIVVANPSCYSIEQLANMAFVSYRQLERQFLMRVGMTPTLYIRQARFAKAYLLKAIKPELKWTQISNTCGYFDQTHMIRDFKSFAGATPKKYQEIIQL